MRRKRLLVVELSNGHEFRMFLERNGMASNTLRKAGKDNRGRVTLTQSNSFNFPVEEIFGTLKPLPRWKMLLGTFLALVLLSLGVPAAYPLTLDLQPVVFSILLIVTISLVITLLFRKRAIQVRLGLGDGCVMISEASEGGRLTRKLVPSRVELKPDGTIVVEREGRAWEFRRMELRFASTQDADKALIMLKQSQQGSKAGIQLPSQS